MVEQNDLSDVGVAGREWGLESSNVSIHQFKEFNMAGYKSHVLASEMRSSSQDMPRALKNSVLPPFGVTRKQ